MSQSTFGVRCTKIKKSQWDKVLKDIPEKFSNLDMSKEDALTIVFNTYLEKHEPDSLTEDETLKLVMNAINCKWLRFEGNVTGFICNEFFHDKKKGTPIGYSPDNVIQRCHDCIEGKEDAKQDYIEKQLQKDSIRKILELRKTFLAIASKGLEVEVFGCNVDLYETGALFFSTEGVFLPCQKREGRGVRIEKTCMNEINDVTLSPPCKHLFDLHQRAKVKDFDEMIKDFEKALPPLIEDDDKPPIKKPIEVDSKVIDDEEGIPEAYNQEVKPMENEENEG